MCCDVTGDVVVVELEGALVGWTVEEIGKIAI